MAIAKMNKVYLIAHQAEKEQVLSILQKSGMVEISDLQTKDAGRELWAELVESDQDQDALQELEGRLADVRFALDFLNRHYPAKKGLMDSLSGKEAVPARQFEDAATELSEISSEVYRVLRAADDKLISLRNEETRLQNLKAQLEPWSKLDMPLEEVRATNAVRVELGVLPSSELPVCREALAALETVILEEINIGRNDAYVVLAYVAGMADQVLSVLKEHNFNKHSFPGLTGTPAANLTRIGEELAAAAAEREQTLADAALQAEHRHTLNRFSDFLAMERDKKQIVASLARTSNSFVVQGWMREADLPALKERLSSCTETVELVSRLPLAGESFPVALENKRGIAPFEFITKLYGTPHPYGVDPTLALTPFFIIFFGLCMTDAGYGITIVLLAALALWKLKLGDGGRKLMWVLLAGGLSTIVFGALVGGWFGGLIPLEALFFNALEDPMRMLIYALALGVIQIFFGMAIKFHANVKEGKILDAIFDQGLWYLFIIGLLLLAAPGMGDIGKILAIAGAAGLVLTQGRTQPTLIKKFLSGVLSLYNITGYLSDVLSYSRLLALGLATGVIALAINTMAGLLGGSIIGYVVMVPLLIGGHAFNLVINTLGSYIHSSRLQYIEFYNRFYDGGGRSFLPFKLNTRHIEVVPEWRESAKS